MRDRNSTNYSLIMFPPFKSLSCRIDNNNAIKRFEPSCKSRLARIAAGLSPRYVCIPLRPVGRRSLSES